MARGEEYLVKIFMYYFTLGRGLREYLGLNEVYPKCLFCKVCDVENFSVGVCERTVKQNDYLDKLTKIPVNVKFVLKRRV